MFLRPRAAFRGKIQKPRLCKIRKKRYPAVWRSALLGVVTMFDGYYDFPLRMSFFKIADRFSRVA